MSQVPPPDECSFTLSAHAAHMVAERRIDAAWIEAVFTNPDRTEPDPAVNPPRVVTVFFDRRLRNRL
jgi:hypothetical protein